jgi:hypothetical protein
MVTDQMSFSLDDKVRFTKERLDVLTVLDRRRLEGRVGLVKGFRNGSRKPIVYFPEVQGQRDLRLFGVDPHQLELVLEDVLQSNAQPQPGGNIDDSDKLSQEDTDHLFD